MLNLSVINDHDKDSESKTLGRLGTNHTQQARMLAQNLLANTWRQASIKQSIISLWAGL